jgi:phosphate/sulfate permease
MEIFETHDDIQVGAVIFLGCYADGSKSVAWNVVYPILGAWVLTVPLAGLFSSAIAELIKLGM